MKKILIASMLAIFAMSAFAEGEATKEAPKKMAKKGKKKGKHAAAAAAAAAEAPKADTSAPAGEVKKEEAPAAAH